VRIKKLIAQATSAAAITALAVGPVTAAQPGPPIQHLVVIFGENISFDHYFGTYPVAKNPTGETKFVAHAGTPSVNGLSPTLRYFNPNRLNKFNNNPSTNSVPSNPFRLDISQAATADQDHDYMPEQLAFDHGLMDLFPLSVGTAGAPPDPPPSQVTTTALTMGYYDGNTVTALWNYAQHFTLNDNFYGTNFGPSTVGAINLISGQTNGVIHDLNPGGATVRDGYGGLTDIGDADPTGDVCSTTSGETFQMSGKNIGDLLNAAGITWGWFEGGFDLTVTNPNNTTGCKRSTTSTITGSTKADYIPHHEPFQYYASTANPTHVLPSSASLIGTSSDGANHQYDINAFYDALAVGNFPAVSFIKAPGFQDAHAGYSDPIDEQTFVVNLVNFLESQADWGSTAIVITYDDSDGWYDHQMGPIVNQSTTASDALTGSNACGNGNFAFPEVKSATLHAQGRCGFGPRLPILVISPFANANYVDHTVLNQASIINYIESHWLQGKGLGPGSMDGASNSIGSMLTGAGATPTLFLDPSTGAVAP
jgi:phospholipase C